MGESVESESEDNALVLFECDEIDFWAPNDTLDRGFR